MISFVLLHLPAALFLWLAVSQFLRAKRRCALAPLNYWQLGMQGYCLVATFVSGLLWNCVEVLWLVCVAGFIVSIAFEVAKMLKTNRVLKKSQDEMDAQLNEIIKNIEEAQETIYSRELQQMMEAPYDQR